MQISQDTLINLSDLIGESSLKFSLIDLHPQSSFFVAQIAILDTFSVYSGVSLFVKITAKQLADLIKHSIQNIPLTAELFEGSILVSQLASGVAL